MTSTYDFQLWLERWLGLQSGPLEPPPPVLRLARCLPGEDPLRARLEAACAHLEAVAATIIAELDLAAPDPDLEDDEREAVSEDEGAQVDHEYSLGAANPSGRLSQLSWSEPSHGAVGGDAEEQCEDEGYDSDREPDCDNEGGHEAGCYSTSMEGSVWPPKFNPARPNIFGEAEEA